MDRAFSTIAVKDFSEEERVFRGLATSPVPDRVLDVVEPLGMKYQNPTVLLRAHDHTMPIGEVTFDRPTKAGVGFTARIPKIQEPGLLKDRVDMAWGEVKHGLVRAVSIGFRPLETEPLPNGGIRYKKSECFELSTVTVPAQALATIDQVKAIDAAVRRGEGTTDETSSLWQMIGSLGARTLDEFEAAPGYKDFGRLGLTVATTVSTQEMLKALCSHIEGLERRLTENPLQYRGVWREQPYPAGSFVTHGGSMFHTAKATSRKPGEGDWTLAVKRGADAR
jgi:hypothetical protein